MPFLYGNKEQQVLTQGDDIEEIVPFDDSGGVISEGEDGEISTTVGDEKLSKEKEGTTEKIV